MRRFWFTKSQVFVLVLGSLTVGSLANYLALSALPAPVAAQEEKAKPKYFKGRVAPKNLAHLIAVSHAQHGRHLKRMKQTLTPPATWDSRTKGWVPPVQDQQQCGSCWDFSGTGVCDIAYMVAGMGASGQNWLFSEQYTLSCGSNGGCNGDDNTTVLKWAKDTGLPLQSIYGPYTASSGRCSWTSAETLYKISDWGFADSSGGDGVTPAADIKSAIMQYGCVGCGVAADDSFSNYSSGVFDTNTSSSIDHDVILIGWDDTKSKTPGKTVWLLRNSWNTSWGIDGYMWIGEGINMVGSESVWAVANNPSPPAPQPLPPFLKKTTLPGNGWSGQLTFDGGILTIVTPAEKPVRKEGNLPSYRPELTVKP